MVALHFSGDMALYLIIALCSKCVFSIPQVSAAAQTAGAAASGKQCPFLYIQADD